MAARPRAFPSTIQDVVTASTRRSALTARRAFPTAADHFGNRSGARRRLLAARYERVEPRRAQLRPVFRPQRSGSGGGAEPLRSGITAAAAATAPAGSPPARNSISCCAIRAARGQAVHLHRDRLRDARRRHHRHQRSDHGPWQLRDIRARFQWPACLDAHLGQRKRCDRRLRRHDRSRRHGDLVHGDVRARPALSDGSGAKSAGLGIRWCKQPVISRWRISTSAHRPCPVPSWPRQATAPARRRSLILRPTTSGFSAAGDIRSAASTVGDYASLVSVMRRAMPPRSIRWTSAANSVKTEVESRRSSVEGVNLDEELSNMIVYQQAYNAAARLVTVAKESVRHTSPDSELRALP